MDSKLLLLGSILGCLIAAASAPCFAGTTTVLFNDRVVEIEETLADPNDLWVAPEDLTRITGFVLKPEGACLDEICILVDQSKDNAMMVTRQGRPWFNVTELARKLGQAYVGDHETNLWSFGEIPATRTAFLDGAIAPDFALKDRQGKTVHLSDFRGKKVLIVTWASW